MHDHRQRPTVLAPSALVAIRTCCATAGCSPRVPRKLVVPMLDKTHRAHNQRSTIAAPASAAAASVEAQRGRCCWKRRYCPPHIRLRGFRSTSKPLQASLTHLRTLAPICASRDAIIFIVASTSLSDCQGCLKIIIVVTVNVRLRRTITTIIVTAAQHDRLLLHHGHG